MSKHIRIAIDEQLLNDILRTSEKLSIDRDTLICNLLKDGIKDLLEDKEKNSSLESSHEALTTVIPSILGKILKELKTANAMKKQNISIKQ